MCGQNDLRIALILSAVLVHTVAVVFTSFAWAGNNELFSRPHFDVFFEFPTQVTLDGWIKWLTILFLTFQTAWLLYGVSTICRKDTDGVYIYQLDINPPGMYIAYTIGNLFRIAYFFAIEHESFIAALVLSASFAVALFIALIFSIYYVKRDKDKFKSKGMKTEICLIQNLVQYGILVYAVVMVAVTLGLVAIVMTYDGIVVDEWSSTTVLILYLFFILGWFLFDIFGSKQKYLTIGTLTTPYTVYIIALSAILSENFDLVNVRQNTIFALVLLSLSAFLLILSIIFHYCPLKKKTIPK